MSDLPWQWIVSLIVQVVSTIVGIFGAYLHNYYKTRELIFQLHNENKDEMNEIRNQSREELSHLRGDVAVIKNGMTPILNWWNTREERRSR